MSIRRRLMSAVCLLSLGSSAVLGQDKNPFADWDRLQKKSETSAGSGTPASSRKGRVAYFSPSGSAPLSGSAAAAPSQPTTPAAAPAVDTAAAAAAAAESAADSDVAVPLIRERMRTRTAAPIAADTATASAAPAAAPAVPTAAAAPAVSAAAQPTAAQAAAAQTPTAQAQPNQAQPTPAAPTGAWPAAFDVRSAHVPLVNSPAADRPVADGSAPAVPSEPVQHADFVKSAETPDAVVPVSGTELPAAGNAAAGNPFAELLEAGRPELATAGGQRPSAAPAASTAPAATAADLALPEESGVQSPGVTLEWVRHGDFNVGQTCQLELVVQNTSRSTVRGVTTEAVVPAGLEVISATPEPLPGTTAPSWMFGELKAGEKRSVSLQVIPRQRGDIRLGAFVRLTGFTSSNFSVQEPLVAIDVNGPEQIEVGQQVSYTVRVHNPGTGVASNVLIQAVIPDGLEHRRGSLLTIEIGTLNPGESRQAQLSLAAVRGGMQQMAVRVVADGGLSDQTMAAVSIAEPRLQLQIAGPAAQLAGREEHYALQVVNEGSVPSANVRAKYRVPEGFAFVSADRGGKYNDIDRSIEWFVGTVQPGESSRFEVALRAEQTGQALHQAGVISEHGRVTMAELPTLVEGTAALELKIAANRTDLKVGDDVTYEIQVANTGSRAAAGVGMSCELPPGLELLQAAGPSEYIAENGVMVFRSLPQIEAGKAAVFAVKLRCTREGQHRLRLRVASESVSEPLIGEESSRVSAR